MDPKSEDNKLDSKVLRNVAGGFATGVTVVTTVQKYGEGDIRVMGMTASSFVSISLEPALVGFFVMNTAEFMTALRIGQPVAISILSADQKALSDQFADRNKRDTPIDFEINGSYHKIADTLAWYETTVVGISPAGDHLLITCQVEDLGRDASKSPLLYYSGYKGIGAEIK